MAKTANPADAHRKAQRKKELKKNKDDRKKTREIQTVKKDTRSLEGDIRKLSDAAQRAPLSAADRDELASLRAELARVQKAKTDYVEAHPEHRKFVFPDRKEAAEASGSGSGNETGLYGKDGKLRHPEKSIYYDPVFNPFGAPPPGMPYRERPPTAEELAAFMPQVPEVAAAGSDDSDGSDGDDDDIALPDGPPPEPSDSDSSDEEGLDDIPMPDGPPPPKHSLPDRPSPMIARPRGAPPPRQFAQPFHPDPHMRHPLPHHRPYPQRPHHPGGFADPMSMGQPPRTPFQPHVGAQGRPFNAPTGQSHLTSSSEAVPAAPAPISAGTSGPFLAFPNAAPTSGTAAATISAAPQLRDLKKEATAFVPSAMRKKKATGGATVKVNAAPGMESGAVQGESRASLKDALSGVGIAGAEKVLSKADQGKEDYERFQQQMQGFL